MSVPPVGTPVRLRTLGNYGTEILAPGQIWATAGSGQSEFTSAGLEEVTGEDCAHVLVWFPSEGNATTGIHFNATEGDALGQFRRVSA